MCGFAWCDGVVLSHLNVCVCVEFFIPLSRERICVTALGGRLLCAHYLFPPFVVQHRGNYGNVSILHFIMHIYFVFTFTFVGSRACVSRLTCPRFDSIVVRRAHSNVGRLPHTTIPDRTTPPSSSIPPTQRIRNA